MNDDLITLLAPPTEFEANILAIVLKDNGIEAFVFSTPGVTFGVSFSEGGTGFPLQVRQADVEIASQILLENKRHSIDIDWSELKFGGSDDVTFEPKMMPISARVAFFCVLLALIAGLVVVILQLLN